MIQLFVGLFTINVSNAILGAYIPESEHIPQACKITVETVLYQKRAVDPSTGKLTGSWITEKEEKDYFFCSGTLIDSNVVASASHCSQLVINENAPHYDAEEIEVTRDDPKFDATLTNVAKKILKDGPLTKEEAAELNAAKDDESKRAIIFRIAENVAIKAGMIKKNKDKETYQVVVKIAKRSIMPGKIFATCGISTGKPETQELKWQNSWPHPRLRNDDPAKASIDTGLYRTDVAFSFPPMPTSKSYPETLALLRNTSSCRAFGFGIDNKKESGKLHGVRVYQYNNVSEYIIMSQTHFNGTMFGDSGGTLTCKDPKGNDVLVGSVQGGLPIEPSQWMGTKQTFAFTPMSYGPVRRWHQFVRSLPITSQHCGRKPCAENYPILNMYVAEFDAVNELGGLIQDLHDVVDIYSPYYSKSFFAGYKYMFNQVKAAHEDILSEYNDWKTESPIISGKTLYIRALVKNNRPTDLKEVILGEPFQYKYTQFPKENFPAYTRMRAFMLMQYLGEEIFAIKHQGLSVAKDHREILDHAREHYWEYLEKEIKRYQDSFL